MSISSMGSRAALRQMQDIDLAAPGAVVTGIAVPGSNDVNTRAGAAAPPVNPAGEYLKALAAWIPAEALALWTGFATFFAVFEDTQKELVLVAVVGILTVVYAANRTRASQARRNLPLDRGKQAKTAVVAVAAFITWWFGTPGAYFTADVKVPPFYAALALAAVVLALPWVAKKFGVEPAKS